MDKEEDIKQKIFNTVHIYKKDKRKYFRIEKSKLPYSKENKSKQAIFKTKKEYSNLLNKKRIRELENAKSNKNNKFITVTVDDTTASVQSDNSFLIQNIIPKKILIKENKKEQNYYIFPKSNENNENFSNNINIDNYKIKLMSVYFYSIKNLCKFINKNLFNLSINESIIKDDEFIYQIYQDLQILNRKINDYKIRFQTGKDNFKINTEDFNDISSLKQNLLLMKNTLNNTMSQNLINIYLNLDTFCKLYSS